MTLNAMDLLRLDITDQPSEDRLALIAKDPDNHDDFNRILPKSTPLFVWSETPQSSAYVRWSMPRSVAEDMGFWGKGCACCGAGGGNSGKTWEFDTRLSQVSWYFEGLERLGE